MSRYNRLNIVVEGPDGAGKTTLVKKMAHMLGIQPPNSIGPPRSQAEMIGRIMGPLGERILLDRWSAISEQVYGPILRGRVLVSTKIIGRHIINENPLIFYCRPPDEVLERNLSALRKKKIHKPSEHCREVQDKYWEIVKCYDELMQSLHREGLIVVNYDYSRGDEK